MFDHDQTNTMTVFSFLIGVAVVLLAGCGAMFFLLFKTIKDNQARFEKRLDRVEYKIDKIVEKLKV